MTKQTYLIIWILLGTWLVSCQDYIDNRNTPSVVDGNKIEVTIATNVPAITVQTRGVKATTEENRLDAVDILVFEQQGEEKVFAYRRKNTNDLSDFEEDEKVYVKTQLDISENGEKYLIVLIANLRSELDALFGGNNEKEEDYAGVSKEELLERITFKQNGLWAASQENFRPLPMWGETTTAVEIQTNTTFDPIDLIRSVARIELGVYISDEKMDVGNGKNLFDIKEVKVYNVREQGRATPDPDYIIEKDNEKQVTDPTLVEDSDFIDPVPVYGESYISDNKLTSIYVNEARNLDGDKKASDALYLIVKAVYRGDNKDNEEATFYRIDFYNDENEPVDLLRNFTYNMRIVEVSGPGSESEDGANSGNLTTALTDWSNGEMKYVVFSGKYYLAVSECHMTVPRPEATHQLKVKTNFEAGWSAIISEDSRSWLKELSPNASSNPETDMYFKVEANDKTERTGTISISCGNILTLDVHVTQTTEEEYSLTILINNPNYGKPGEEEYIEFDRIITFHSGAHRKIDPRTVKVIWEPARMPLKVDFTEYFAWGDGTNIDREYNDGTGVATFQVVPAALEERAPEDWYPEAMGDIQVQIGEDNTTKQNILIRRRHYEVYIEKADKYILDGDEHTFKLYSNTDWKAEVDPNQVLDNLADYIHLIDDEGGYNLGDGEDIKFELAPADRNISADVIVNITFLDLDTEVTKPYTFHVYGDYSTEAPRLGDEANCYVLHTNGRAVSIPLSQANRHTLMTDNHIASGANNLDIKFIWTDHPNGFNKNNDDECPVKSAEIDYSEGNGPKARLIVEPGSKPGNAVIAVSTGNTIHWSWHIWVVEDDSFDPYNGEGWDGFRYYEFLDRNLGALSATPGIQENLGLYYQWGRKDPFPSAEAPTTLNANPALSKRYDKDGNTISWDDNIWKASWNDMAGGNTLMKTIQDPKLFISPSSNGTWYSTDWDAYETKDFWSKMLGSSLSSSEKGIFDPCPEGWKTVPAGDQLDNAWNSLPQLVSQTTVGNYTYSTIKDNSSINLGVWPHTGYINGSSGQILDFNNAGNYWTGTYNSVNSAFRTRFWHNGQRADGHPSIELAQMNALPVRCIRRMDKLRE